MLILMLLVVVTWLIYALVTSQARLVVWDFHPPWTGVRAMLREGANPYSEEVTQRIQMEMLGRLPGASEDQYAFVYPLHLMVLIGPLALLPLPAPQAVWFSFLVMGLVTFILAAQRAVGWHPSRWLLSLTALFAVGLYSTVWALVLGQLAIVVAAFIALAWWNLRAGRWTVAGVCLALATVKPQMSFLFVPSVVLWAALRRRWILIASFGGSLLLLCLVPVPWMPAWPVAWIRAMMDYSVYAPFAAPLTTLTGSRPASARAAFTRSTGSMAPAFDPGTGHAHPSAGRANRSLSGMGTSARGSTRRVPAPRSSRSLCSNSTQCLVLLLGNWI